MENRFENACKLSELMRANRQCARNVRWKSSVISYENKALLKNYILKKEIEEGRYKISPYIKFYVHEPKKRLIHATRMRDRVWQRSLRNNGLYDDLTKGFIASNGACQIGRGTHHTVDDLISQLQKYYRKEGTNKGWAAHLDIKSYFPTTPHDVAKATLRRKVQNSEMLKHVEAIIDSCKDTGCGEEGTKDHMRRGIYLGSEVFQLVQIANLDGIDRYLKERLHAQVYSRYNDDFIIASRNLEHVKECVEYVKNALGEMGLDLNEKSNIYPLQNGIKYLKLKFKLTETGKVLLLVEKKTISKERRKLRKLKALLDDGKITINEVRSHYEGFDAHKKNAHTRGMRKKMNKYYTEVFSEKPTVTLEGGR